MAPNKLTQRFWKWILFKAIPHMVGGSSFCANRASKTFHHGNYEVTIESRDTSRPDGYERTEVLRMLTKVREAERAQNWKCPEPEVPNGK